MPGSSSPLALGPFLELLEDRDGSLRIDDVRSAAYESRFLPNRYDAPSFGFTDSAYWARFRLKADEWPVAQRYLVEIRWPNLDRVDFYAVARDGSYRRASSGDSLPFEAREIRHRDHVFELRPDREQTYYLRIQTQGTLTIPAYLWTADAFFSWDRDAQILYGLFYGLVLALILYNAMLYLTIRDAAYLYYVLYAVMLGMFIAGVDGLSYQYFWPSSRYGANNGLMVVGGLTLAAGSQFGRRFLGTRQRARLADIPLLLIAIAALALAAISAADVILTYSQVVRVFNLLVSAFMITMLAGALAAFLQGYRPARYFLIAWAAAILGGLVFTMRNLSVLPHNFVTLHSAHLGFALDLLLLAFALGDRINVIQREAEAARSEAHAMEIAHRHEQELRAAIEREERKSQHLLANVFPQAVIPRLRAGETPIADQFADVTVVFIDIEDFTPLSERLGPRRMVLLLNDLFGRFDAAALKLGVEKIETTGDGYLAVAGAPGALDAHAEAAADFALAAVEAARQVPAYPPEHVRVRIGLHTGPVLAGVVGESRFHYKVFGETVNVASRVQAQGRPGSVLVSETSFKRLISAFELSDHATLELKGHGPMRTFWLLARRSTAPLR